MLYQDRLMTQTRNTTQKEEGVFTQPYTSMSYTPEASAKGSTVHHGSGAMRKPPFKKETPLFAPFPDRTYTTTRSFTKTASGRVHGQLNRQKICGVCSAGKLHLEIDMEYATSVSWSDTGASRVAGSSQPLLTADFDESLGIPLAELQPDRDDDDASAFVSFRLVELVLDDGPEQGSIRAIDPESVNNGGAFRTSFVRHFILKPSSICQDRLGTNIWKVESKDTFPQVRRSPESTARVSTSRV
jgi:hypothetical protein